VSAPERPTTAELVERARAAARDWEEATDGIPTLPPLLTALAARLERQDRVLRVIGGIAWEGAPGALARVQHLADEETGQVPR
jgi:hypothetical protein